jgi:hypothetical protein
MKQYKVTFKSYAGESSAIVEAPTKEVAKRMAKRFFEIATSEIIDIAAVANTKAFRITSMPTVDL